MIILHDGPKLILTLDQQTLTLDVKHDGVLTDAQLMKIDRLMYAADEGSWFGEALKRHQIEALVKEIESPRPARDPMEPWTSRAEEARARQQRIGGR